MNKPWGFLLLFKSRKQATSKVRARIGISLIFAAAWITKADLKVLTKADVRLILRKE